MTKDENVELQKLTELVTKLYTCSMGIENTDDNGMAGDVKDIKVHLKALNGQVDRNTTFRKIGTWVSCAIVIALLSLMVKIFSG